LVLGILIGLFALLAVVLVIYKKKRKEKEAGERLADEKSLPTVAVQEVNPRPRAGPAPQLELRPVTEFSPNLGNAKETGANGNMLGVFSSAPGSPRTNQARGPPPYNEKDQFGQNGARGVPAPLNVNGRSTSPQPLLNGPPSPSGTEFSTSSMEGRGAAGATPSIASSVGGNSSPVHRVQLDFKPSMQDELELRAGQLVRMLHEYDDGWVSFLWLTREYCY
jgi:hypothetical protein